MKFNENLHSLTAPSVPFRIFLSASILISMLSLSGCGASDSNSVEETVVDVDIELDDSNFEVSDWTDSTHSKSADPNFDEVFDSTQVKRLDMVITEERWQSMLDDMTNLYGEFGELATELNPPLGEGLEGGMPEEGLPEGGIPEEVLPVVDSDELTDDTEDPIFVAGDVYYNDIQWYKVGLRFKGNSSLKSSWQQGILKLSFKLDFDEFEDDYPQIDNQRFYGFKKLSLKNNYQDSSLLREKVAADTFSNADLVVSHSAFYALYIDHGNGPTYFGLYTLVEEVNDTVIGTQFSSDEGNLYKPEGDGASFIEGAFAEESFEKKTNEDDADWSDIQALFSALHDDESEPEVWRENLEAVFDVDTFLKYLAVNGVIQNWDSYGRMTHNFYLYNNPESGKLTWIPWDHNETLQEGQMGGALDLDFANLEQSEWPLIAKIIADDVYQAQYDEYLLEVISDAFELGAMELLYDSYAALVESYALDEVVGYTFLNGSSDFANAITVLKDHASSRQIAVDTYLNQ